MEGSDDNTLLASLRTDGSAAHIDGYAEATMVADASPAPSLFSLFSSSPAPAPAPTRVAARPAPAAPAPEPEPEAASVAVAESSPRPRIAHPPTPPERPFDLGAARHDSLMALASAPLPPTRVSSNDRALYFAPLPPRMPEPFVRTLKPAKLKSLADSED